MRQELRPSIVFSTMPVFEMLRIHLINLNYRSIQFIDTKVSIDRINDFLHDVSRPANVAGYFCISIYVRGRPSFWTSSLGRKRRRKLVEIIICPIRGYHVD